MLEHPRSSLPIACLTRSGTEGLNRNRDIFTLRWESSILDHLARCCQLGYSACLARRSFQVGVRSCASHRHIPYERPARAPRNQCQPIWAFAVRTIKSRWFLRHRDAGWGKRFCCNIVEEVAVSYSSACCSLTDKTFMAKWVGLWTTTALVRHTEVKS